MRDGGGREETAASSGDDRSVRERRSVVRRRRTTGENNDVGGEGKHAAQVHLTALLPQPPEVEKVRQDASTRPVSFASDPKRPKIHVEVPLRCDPSFSEFRST